MHKRPFRQTYEYSHLSMTIIIHLPLISSHLFIKTLEWAVSNDIKQYADQ